MNMRPGVYTEHTITKLASAYKAKPIAIIAKGGAPLVMKIITTKDEAIAEFPQGTNALAMIGLVQEHLWCNLHVVGIENAGSTDDYKAALDLVLAQDKPYCIVTDVESVELIQYASKRLADEKFTKLFFSGCSTHQSPTAFATSINNERVCLACPKITGDDGVVDISPLLLAIMVTKGNNISNNLAGTAVTGFFETVAELTEKEKNEYLYNGISVFEQTKESVRLIRGMTTKTLDLVGNYDPTYRNICVVVSADTVKSTISDMLASKLLATNQAMSAGAVLSLVVCELISLLDKQVISSYDKPIVTVLETDKSICKVAVNVTISQGINQIYLQLNMNV